MENIIQAPRESIYLHLPHYRMRKEANCGPAATLSLGSFYGFGPKTEAGWAKILNTTYENGTEPKDIVESLRSFGLTVCFQRNLEIEELTENIKQGNPVICAIQAWGNPSLYRKLDSGHWVIAIGFDEKNIYFEDSLCTRSRGYMTKLRFLNRWHGVDGLSKYLNQLGLIVKCPWEPVKEYHLFKSYLVY